MDRENEYENPGGNYPDQGGAAEGSQQDDALMDQHPTGNLAKVAGIMVQTRADVGTESVDRIASVLRQRIDDAGLTLTDTDVTELAEQIASGDAESASES